VGEGGGSVAGMLEKLWLADSESCFRLCYRSSGTSLSRPP